MNDSTIAAVDSVIKLLVTDFARQLKAKRYTGAEVMIARHRDGAWSIALETSQQRKFFVHPELAQARLDALAWIDQLPILPSAADLAPWFDPFHPLNAREAEPCPS